MRTETRWMNAVLGVLALGVVGCGGLRGEDVEAGEALDSTEVASRESALLASASDASQGAMTGDASAERALTAFPARFLPAGCATATRQGNVATVALNHCSGPYGLLDATGTLTVTYTRNGESMLIHIAGQSLTIAAGVFDFDADATVMSKMISVETRSAGAGANGNRVARQGSYTASWDASCVTLSGTWNTRVGARVFSTRVTDFRRCAGMCPDSGTIVHSRTAPPFSVTLTFDGDGMASFVTSNNRSGSIDLMCR